MIYSKYVKRAFDMLLSGLTLLALSPIIGIVALLVLIFMGRPIIFKQERTGKKDKNFYIYKFKTMKDTRDENGELLHDEERKCRFGEILRSTSLDELPELWNIFTGDMSIIGPRPLLPAYLPYYNEEELDRHLAVGGLIPPDIVDCSLTPTWEEQLASEAEYARNVTFKKDFKIFFMVFVVIYRRITEGYGEYVREPLYNVREVRKDKETVNL